ncbi:MAG: dihydroorotase [Desulfovibrionaceae bacterium]|nr:dihydroorotase [Desulfovibrionaceae bacterium]
MLRITNAAYLGELRDVLVENGHIAGFGPAGSLHGENTFDAKGRKLFPGFTDAHTHLREPGGEWKETIASGLDAAAHGGFVSVMCMGNTNPVNEEAGVTRQMLDSASASWPHGPRLYPIGAATVGLKGEELTRMHELKKAGCVAISNDGKPVANTEIFRRVMEYAADLGMIVIDHCEDPFLAVNTHMNEGITSGILGLRGQPDVAETIQAARSIFLAEYLNIPVHIAHVSARKTVDLIAWAKQRGVKVTAETTPHYLLLDETAVGLYDTNAKVNPPLRTQADIASLREAVKSGVIDILVTDHAPHAVHEKEVPFDRAPNGFTGMDLAVSLTYDLVRQNVLSEEDLIRLWAVRPAEIFGLPCNQFRIGDPADFFLFDPEEEWTVSRETLHSKSCNTPWLGQKLCGRVSNLWIGGYQIF